MCTCCAKHLMVAAAYLRVCMCMLHAAGLPEDAHQSWLLLLLMQEPTWGPTSLLVHLLLLLFLFLLLLLHWLLLTHCASSLQMCVGARACDY